MTKKNFKDDPALQFITPPGEDPKGDRPAEDGSATQDVPAFVPMKRNPEYIETKSRRVNLMMQPSLYNRIKGMADRRGASVNEMIHSILEAKVNGGGQ